ncbi:MAG: alpha/beta hydrolase [Halanaeroarchaeum sp.]
MTGETVTIPGSREAEATLDEPSDGASVCVVACPPHPRHGGNRADGRLKAVSEALEERGIATLRFDYGEWDHGEGEREDTRNALRWAADRFEHVGIFGYSFGGAMAASAAATTDVDLCAVSFLSPASRIGLERSVEETVAAIDAPLLLVGGSRDDTAQWEPYRSAVESRGGAVTELGADHFFVGQWERVGSTVASFVQEACEIAGAGRRSEMV